MWCWNGLASENKFTKSSPRLYPLGIQLMKKFEIKVVPERCTGCLRCGLICSEHYTGAFNPSRARIQVEVRGVECMIKFTDECNSCGICVEQCLYQALQKSPRERSK